MNFYLRTCLMKMSEKMLRILKEKYEFDNDKHYYIHYYF